MPLGRPLGRPQPASRTAAAGQLIGGGRPAKTATAGQRNGYGRRAERQRPFSGLAAAGRQIGHGRQTGRRPSPYRMAAAAILQSGGGSRPTEWRRPPQRVGSAALYRAKHWPKAAGPGRPQAFRERPSVPPPLCLTAAVGKAVCGRGHCGHIRPCMLGHYIRQGRLKRPPGLTERPVSAADRDAPCAARQGRVGPAGRPHPPAPGGGDVAVEWLSFFPKTNIDPGQVKRG